MYIWRVNLIVNLNFRSSQVTDKQGCIKLHDIFKQLVMEHMFD